MPDMGIQDPARLNLVDREFMAWNPVNFSDGIIEDRVAKISLS